MASIDKRPLKAFVRFDGTGRVVSSSLILRRKMPKVGKWVEISAYECCNTVTMVYYTPTLPITFPLVSIFCNGVFATSGSFSGSYTTIGDLVVALNIDENTSAFGTYSAGPNGNIKLTLNPATIAANCSTGTISMTIISD